MVSFAAEPVFHIGALPITNTLIDTMFVDAILIGGVVAIRKKLSVIPGLFQNAVESIIETFYDLTESIAAKKAHKIFPYFMTFFVVILITNLSGLLPGVGSIGFFEHGELIPLIRSSTSDINMTFGLALVSLVSTHMLSIKTIGLKEYSSKFFSLNPIYLFIGLLEIIGEITKVISLSFRLFGNIFAGEVVLTTVSGIFAFLFPVPFLLLESIVGVVQALVFSMLTMAFMSILTTVHHET